ncbi:MAG: O-antigen ligase family protein [Methylococcus sp.]
MSRQGEDKRYAKGDGVVFYGLIGLYLIAPLPLGSVGMDMVYLICGVTYALSAFWCLLFVYDKAHLSRSFRRSWPILILWGLYLIYVFLQAKSSVFAPSSPLAMQIHAASNITGLPTAPTISIHSHATLMQGWLSLAYFLIFCLTLLVVRSHKRLRILAYAIAVCGVVQACYGIFMAMSGFDASGMGDRIAHGSFFNRNHFAGYLELCLPVAIGLLAGSARIPRTQYGWREWLQQTVRFLLSQKASLRIGILIMALGLILSRSRMGNSAFLGSLTLVSLAFSIFTEGTFRTRLLVIWVTILTVDVTILGSYFGLEELQQRLEQTTTTEVSNRVDISDHLQYYVFDYQPWGSGLGTFRDAFKAYQSELIRIDYDYAENDYLQFLGELGMIGSAPLALMVLTSLGLAMRGAYQTQQIFIKGMNFAFVMAMVSLLIHSSVDFNLQIPANSMLLVGLLALPWLTPYLRQEKVVSLENRG